MNKKFWTDGPWQNEPDSLIFYYKNLECALIRDDLGFWKGFVMIPEELEKCPIRSLLDLDVYGETLLIEGGMIGFQCNCMFDGIPCYAEDEDTFKIYVTGKETPMYGKGLKSYKDINFAKNECKKLADQLDSLKENNGKSNK